MLVFMYTAFVERDNHRILCSRARNVTFVRGRRNSSPSILAAATPDPTTIPRESISSLNPSCRSNSSSVRDFILFLSNKTNDRAPRGNAPSTDVFGTLGYLRVRPLGAGTPHPPILKSRGTQISPDHSPLPPVLSTEMHTTPLRPLADVVGPARSLASRVARAWIEQGGQCPATTERGKEEVHDGDVDVDNGRLVLFDAAFS